MKSRQLIKESTERVEDGASLSEETGAALDKIVASIDLTAEKIGVIARATVEQANDAKEVGTAIERVAEITEQTAAGSEEMASSSEELGAQASSMSQLVSRFKTEPAGAPQRRANWHGGTTRRPEPTSIRRWQLDARSLAEEKLIGAAGTRLVSAALFSFRPYFSQTRSQIGHDPASGLPPGRHDIVVTLHSTDGRGRGDLPALGAFS